MTRHAGRPAFGPGLAAVMAVLAGGLGACSNAEDPPGATASTSVTTATVTADVTVSADVTVPADATVTPEPSAVGTQMVPPEPPTLADACIAWKEIRRHLGGAEAELLWADRMSNIAGSFPDASGERMVATWVAGAMYRETAEGSKNGGELLGPDVQEDARAAADLMDELCRQQ